jgi:hypothetical protein
MLSVKNRIAPKPMFSPSAKDSASREAKAANAKAVNLMLRHQSARRMSITSEAVVQRSIPLGSWRFEALMHACGVKSNLIFAFLVAQILWQLTMQAYQMAFPVIMQDVTTRNTALGSTYVLMTISYFCCLLSVRKNWHRLFAEHSPSSRRGSGHSTGGYGRGGHISGPGPSPGPGQGSAKRPAGLRGRTDSVKQQGRGTSRGTRKFNIRINASPAAFSPLQALRTTRDLLHTVTHPHAARHSNPTAAAHSKPADGGASGPWERSKGLLTGLLERAGAVRVWPFCAPREGDRAMAAVGRLAAEEQPEPPWVRIYTKVLVVNTAHRGRVWVAVLWSSAVSVLQ